MSRHGYRQLTVFKRKGCGQVDEWCTRQPSLEILIDPFRGLSWLRLMIQIARGSPPSPERRKLGGPSIRPGSQRSVQLTCITPPLGIKTIGHVLYCAAQYVDVGQSAPSVMPTPATRCLSNVEAAHLALHWRLSRHQYFLYLSHSLLYIYLKGNADMFRQFSQPLPHIWLTTTLRLGQRFRVAWRFDYLGTTSAHSPASRGL